MAQGLSTRYRRTGPLSYGAQAQFRVAQAQAECTHVEPLPNGARPFCPKHFYDGCPKAA